MEKEIKLCPFCGGKASVCHPGFTGAYSAVKCENCGAKTDTVEQSTSYCSDDKAIELWNVRAETELSDKHWDECRQFGLYDDELRQAIVGLGKAVDLLISNGIVNGQAKELGKLCDELEKKLNNEYEDKRCETKS